MLQYITGLALFSLLLSCKEDKMQVYTRDQKIGSAVLTDPFRESLTISAPAATIYLANNDKADPFLYTVTADDKGKFTLFGMPKESSGLLVVGKYKNADGITYTGNLLLSSFVANPLTELLLTPQYPGGVLKFQLNDGTVDKKPVVGADVLLFTAKSQTAVVTDSDPKGVAYKSVTNAKGIVFFSSLQPVTYYAIAKNIINGKTILSDVLEAQVNSTALVTDSKSVTSLTFTYPATLPAVTKASIQITLKDNQENPVAGFTAYLFINAQQAETIKDTLGAKGFVQVADALTDRNGVTKFSNVDPGRYYVAVSGGYGQTSKYKRSMGADYIDVPQSTTATITKSYTIN